MFLPLVDKDLTIDLPGERTRATVVRLVNDDTVIVKLTTMPMAKTHQYRFNDIIACQRTQDGALETWNAIEERRTLPTRMPPAKTEPPHAATAGVKPGRDQPKRQGNDGKRLPPKAGGRGVATKRPGKQTVKRRSSRSR